MPSRVIEGTWEEIKRHEAEFAGKMLRVTIKSEKTLTRKPTASTKQAGQPKQKVLKGYGMLEGLISTEEYFRQKKEDRIREDMNLQ